VFLWVLCSFVGGFVWLGCIAGVLFDAVLVWLFGSWALFGAGFWPGFWGGSGLRTRGFVWASKREAGKWHTETRSNLGHFCLAKVREPFREGLVYNRGVVAWI